MNDIDDLDATLQSLRVRSVSSQKRMLKRSQGVDTEDDDSTFEVDSESDSSDSMEMEEEEVFQVAIPFAELIEYDGNSDYQGSDDGDGPEIVTRLPFRDRILNRAQTLIHQLDLSHFWIIKLSKFSFEQRRWVNKGPCIIYYKNDRLVGNFLYGTKSVCIDMQVYEHFDTFIKHYNNNTCQFSTFGYDAVRYCDTLTEKVPLQYYFPNVEGHHLPVFRCTSTVRSVQEQGHRVLTFRFLDHGDHVRFAQFMRQAVASIRQQCLEKRYTSFQYSKYFSAPEFVKELALNGFQYHPTGHIETVQCTWCGVTIGPFETLCDLRQLHRESHTQGHITCPFT